MKTRILNYIITALIGALFATDLFANGQTSAFTYQGQLTFNGALANGLYDFEFSLFDVSSGSTAVAGPQSVSGVSVSDGLFTVALDFGSSVFDGSVLWLEVGTATNGGGGFTTLSPRQQLTSVPYAIKAHDANTLTGSIASDFSPDIHSHVGGDIAGGIVDAAYIDSALARDAELVWGNIGGIPADIADGDDVGIISEVDPQVGVNTVNYVPRWNGGTLVSGSMYDNGKIGIGTGRAALDKLEVAGDISANSTDSGGAVFRFRKDDAQNWAIMTAPWLNGNDSLWIRNETGPFNIMAFDKISNRVGIHTTDPQATLHVAGDLRVDGSITYGTAQTGYASVAAAAFHPSSSAVTWNNDGVWIYPSVNNAWFYAGVSLPQGSTVTSVEWNAVTAGEGDYARLRLVRRNLAGSAAYMAECYSSSGSSAVLTDSTISSSTVDNSQYVYYLDMFLTAPSTLAHGGATIITYTYPGP